MRITARRRRLGWSGCSAQLVVAINMVAVRMLVDRCVEFVCDAAVRARAFSLHSALLRFQAMESFSAVAVSKMDSAASIFVMYRSQFDELYSHFCVDITQPLQFYGPDRRTSDTYQLPCRTCLTPRQLPARAAG